MVITWYHCDHRMADDDQEDNLLGGSVVIDQLAVLDLVFFFC